MREESFTLERMSVEPTHYRVLSHKTILLWAVAIIATGVGLAIWLLLAYGRDDPLGAIRTAGTVVVGSGGGAALLLAARRQRSAEIALLQKDRDQADVARAHALQERVATENQADAAECRITDLYTQAVEQLGSDKAPVRIGGLYALERLAHDNRQQRQTIVNVLCAYLRMPYQRPEPDDLDPLTASGDLQEREVRLTAQRLLTTHMRTGSPEFWAGMDLDLTGALLIDFLLIEGGFHRASFKAATFAGTTLFLDMSFPHYAAFDEATFVGDTHFSGTTFSGDARFENATFRSSVEFGGYLKSHAAKFTGQAKFQGVTFGGDTSFSEAIFNGWTYFGKSRTGKPATFDGKVTFRGAHFNTSAKFTNTTFADEAVFKDVSFHAKKPSRVPTLDATTDFRSATFTLGIPPEVTPFLDQERP